MIDRFWHLVHRPEYTDLEVMGILQHRVVHNTKGAFRIFLIVSQLLELEAWVVVFDLPGPFLVCIGAW